MKSKEKSIVLKEIKEAVLYLNLVKRGKAKARPVKKLLKEL